MLNWEHTDIVSHIELNLTPACTSLRRTVHHCSISFIPPSTKEFI